MARGSQQQTFSAALAGERHARAGTRRGRGSRRALDCERAVSSAAAALHRLIVAAFPTDAVLEDLPILTAAETYMDSVAQQKPSFLDEVVRERDEARSQIREELRKASRPALVMNVLYQRMIERELQEHSARGRRATERDLVETLDSLQMQLSGHFGVAADKVTYSQATFTRHLLLRPNAIAGLRDLSESELAAAVIDAQVHAGGDPISSDHILRIRAAWANAAPAPWLRRLATR